MRAWKKEVKPSVERLRQSAQRRVELAELAAEVPIELYCQAAGIPLVRCGNGYRHAQLDSLRISGSKWKRWSGKTGAFGKYTAGCTIQFVQEAEGISYQQAVDRIIQVAYPHLALDAQTPIPKMRPIRAPNEPERPALQLPERAPTNNRVLAYLTGTRGIDTQVVKRELDANRLYEDKRGNCVFVGYDEQKEPAFACIRSTGAGKVYKMDLKGSRKAWSWRVEPEKHAARLFVFESPIEALSYMSLIRQKGGDWQRGMYLSLGGVSGSALFNCLDRWQGQLPEVYMCLNNDSAGISGARTLAKDVAARGMHVYRAMPRGEGQDWNDALRGVLPAPKQQMQREMEASRA